MVRLAQTPFLRGKVDEANGCIGRGNLFPIVRCWPCFAHVCCWFGWWGIHNAEELGDLYPPIDCCHSLFTMFVSLISIVFCWVLIGYECVGSIIIDYSLFTMFFVSLIIIISC